MAAKQSGVLNFQGDVALIRVDGPEVKPEYRIKEIEKDGKDRLVLARGEATGHTHSLDAAHVNLIAESGGLILEVTEPTELVHQEHDPILLQPGRYIPVQQHEYDWLEGWRRIQD